MQVQLEKHQWQLGERIGEGGFGAVHAASSDDHPSAVAKLVPKEPCADRELLFVDLTDVRNVVPIIDSGETEDHWVLAMPRADKSLRQHLDEIGGPLDTSEAVAILSDIATALVDLDGKVVHRDLKPDNVLLLEGRWCLADFGISRYAEATTAPDTQKYALTHAYAAPERWRNERATIATDVYSFGIIAYELLEGARPFTGAGHELREQHLHASPAHLTHLSAALASLVEECLYKAPEARPRPGNVLARLQRIAESPSAGGLAKLQEANQAEVLRRGETARRESEFRSDAERRAALVAAARLGLARIMDTMREAITEAAPAAVVIPQQSDRDGWTITLGPAQLKYVPLDATLPSPWGSWDPPAFDVIADASVVLRFPPDRYEYEGRGHSLWFCDAHEAGQYQWFETAFMFSGFVPARGRLYPFALSPSADAAKAVWNGISELQVAWPFTAVSVGDLDEPICRWAEWLADASQGQLRLPSSMPERPVDGSWRRK